jgi:hypothetical protein
VAYCLFLAAAGGVWRTSLQGSEFLFFFIGNPFHRRLVVSLKRLLSFSRTIETAPPIDHKLCHLSYDRQGAWAKHRFAAVLLAAMWLHTSSTNRITSMLFGRPTTRPWEKLPCRISASDRDGRSDPIARCAHCCSTIAERRSDSTTGCGRVLS